MSFMKNLFSSPEPPPVPNPGAIAAAQGAANEGVARTQARLNRADTYTPYGSVTFEELDDETDRWRTDQTLSPAQQGISDQQEALGQSMGELANTRYGQIDQGAFDLGGIQDFQQSIDRSGLSAIPGANDFEAARNEAEDSAFNRAWGRLGTQFDDEQSSMVNDLANQGITLGSDAYTGALDRFNTRKNDARTAAAYDSIGAGRAAYNNMFNNAMTARQQGSSELFSDLAAANVGRQRAIDDRLMVRGQPMNELAAILQGSPAVNVPQQQPMAQVGVAAPDIIGAQSLASGVQAGNYNQQIGQQNAAIGALADLGGAGIQRYKMSDARLKTNIEKVGEVNSLNIYEYEYVWGGPREVGVMAQEVIKVVPEAVMKIGKWFAVDYSKLGLA